MVVVVQKIECEWTKDERDVDWSRRRSAVPDAVLLPDKLSVPSPAAYRYHEVACYYLWQFRPREMRADIGAEKPSGMVSLDLEFDGRTLRGMFQSFGGLPPIRRSHSLGASGRASLELRPGRTARVLLNQRKFLEYTWAFVETTCNIALVEGESVPADIFLSRPPNELIDLRVNLIRRS